MPVKSLIFGLFIAVSTLAVADEKSINYSGIWHASNQSNEFYVIQESGSEVVLVALPGIEETGDTLSYSYIGNKEDLLLTRLSSDPAVDDIFTVVQLNFTSEDSASIIPVCDTCTVVKIDLVKIF